MWMGLIAVDVVVLPDESIARRAIAANAKLVKEFGPEIVLDADKCLPHCSLCMGCLNERDLEAARAILGHIAAESRLEELLITQTYMRRGPEGHDVSHYVVAGTVELLRLHEMVTESLAGYLSYEVSAEMVFGGEEVAQSTLDWIGDYRTASSFANFQPHITLGYGVAEEDHDLPLVSKPLSLALCHLGNHCTCRKVLAEFTL